MEAMMGALRMDLNNAKDRATLDKICTNVASPDPKVSMMALFDYVGAQDIALRTLKTPGLVNLSLYCLERGLLVAVRDKLRNLKESELFRTTLPCFSDFYWLVAILFYTARDVRTVKAVLGQFPDVVKVLEEKAFPKSGEKKAKKFLEVQMAACKALTCLTSFDAPGTANVRDQIVAGGKIIPHLMNLWEMKLLRETDTEKDVRSILILLNNCLGVGSTPALKCDVVELACVIPFVASVLHESVKPDYLLTSCQVLASLGKQNGGLRMAVVATPKVLEDAILITSSVPDMFLAATADSLAKMIEPDDFKREACAALLQANGSRRIGQLRDMPKLGVNDGTYTLPKKGDTGAQAKCFEETGVSVQHLRAPARKCSLGGCSVTETSEKKLRRCSKCLLAAYCSEDCQKKHWPAHKVLCKSVKLEKPPAR